MSGDGCSTERISQLVDFFWQPGVKRIRSYIKDTTYFLSVLSQTDTLDEGDILVTLNMYPVCTQKIPNIEGIEAYNLVLNDERVYSRSLTNDSLMKVLTLVLGKNSFDFNEKHYLQIGGTAICTRVVPLYANTFMGWYEIKFV